MTDQPTITERDAVLREREAFRQGAVFEAKTAPCGGHEWGDVQPEAIRRYPLPVWRVPREEPDPHVFGVFWRVVRGDVLEESRREGEWDAPSYHPTRARVALWNSLFLTPDREVSE